MASEGEPGVIQMSSDAIFLTAVLLAVGLLVAAVARNIFKEEKLARDELTREFAAYRVNAEARTGAMSQEINKLKRDNERLAKWAVVDDADTKAHDILRDADAKAREILRTVELTRHKAESEARILIFDAERRSEAMLQEASRILTSNTTDAKTRAKELNDRAESTLANATRRAAEIVDAANRRAEEIAGKAMDAVNNAALYEQTAIAMKNAIEGYGDQYFVPAHSLLDDLAEEFGHKEAGEKLKETRAFTKKLIKNDAASKCDYVESTRKEGAENFVLDAFNGKVDSILSRVRHTNAGKLSQEIKDAYRVVNFGGRSFRNARITEEYLAARLEELKWAAIVQELKVREMEEQRKIREEIQEEAKAQREFERAIRESAKEEEMLRKAMAKAEAMVAQASAEQKAYYERQLQDLAVKVKEAEERNQRAISMAQQTKRGHVYIISNIGSFGEEIFKIGLTRRLDPLDRVLELGDASVPFKFDVHATIWSEDAPALEYQLHQHFMLQQVNKVNYRKEFFRAKLSEIRSEIESFGIQAKWTMAAEAREYRETLAIDQAIRSSPSAKDAWLRRQLELAPQDFLPDHEDLDADPTLETGSEVRPEVAVGADLSLDNSGHNPTI